MKFVLLLLACIHLTSHAGITLATFKYDLWKSVPLTANAEGLFIADLGVPVEAQTIDVISTHTHEENHIPFHFSSPYRRWTR